MLVTHKFLEFDWGKGFESHNTILDVVPYEPETIFIGSFNPDWDWNPADFYYGRGMYMWPILANLFLNNRNTIENRRNDNTEPTLNQIFEICKQGKITFADIVKGTKNEISLARTGNVYFVNNTYEWDSYKDKQLDYLGKEGYLDDNVDEIVKYINETPSIKRVYFTFKSGHWLVKKMKLIKDQINTPIKGSIFTPSGNGFRRLLVNFPSKPSSIAHCWVWNGLQHTFPITRKGYCNLDHDWLRINGVDINNF